MWLVFVLLAPRAAIDAGTFAGEMDPASIRAKVARRVSAYEGALDAWHERWFAPAMDHVALHSLSWEDAIAWVGRSKETAAASLAEFYRRCLAFN